MPPSLATNPGPDSGISDAAAAAAASSDGCGTGPSLAGRAPEERAEEYLLRTLGAQIAEMVTVRECEKLVRCLPESTSLLSLEKR